MPRGHLEVYSLQTWMLAGLYAFTCPRVSGTQLVQSMFTTQCIYRAFPSFSGRSWWLQTDVPPQQWSFIFRHFVNHPQGLPCWLKFELVQFTCFSSPCSRLFVLSPWKLQSFGPKQVIVWGWAVSVFTMPAPLCAFHSNCLHCQDVTKQISLETKEKDVSQKWKDNDGFRLSHRQGSSLYFRTTDHQ